jgi:hypothetical protein
MWLIQSRTFLSSAIVGAMARLPIGSVMIKCGPRNHNRQGLALPARLGHRHPRLSPLSIPFVRKPQAASCGEALIDDEDDLVGRAELNPGNLHFDLQNNNGDESVHSTEVEPPATFV